jgi:hypothetical protein
MIISAQKSYLCHDDDMASFTIGLVVSKDGTSIGYLQMGGGPGLLLIHGGLNAGQHLMPLAEQLSDAFTAISRLLPRIVAMDCVPVQTV